MKTSKTPAKNNGPVQAAGRILPWSLHPVHEQFGSDPVDRHYIREFLREFALDIQGTVLEVADSQYTRMFGWETVGRSEVLHVDPLAPGATVIGNLATGEGIPDRTYDCLVLTQTLHVIYDMTAAIQHSFRALKEGGVLLATLAGISQISRYDMDHWGDFWRVTEASAKRLFGDVFGAEFVTLRSYGNVLTACAFLHGLAAAELTREELDYHDPNYPILIGVRAVRGLVRTPQAI